MLNIRLELTRLKLTSLPSNNSAAIRSENGCFEDYFKGNPSSQP
jgi:hypothetical protein